MFVRNQVVVRANVHRSIIILTEVGFQLADLSIASNVSIAIPQTLPSPL